MIKNAQKTPSQTSFPACGVLVCVQPTYTTHTHTHSAEWLPKYIYASNQTLILTPNKIKTANHFICVRAFARSLPKQITPTQKQQIHDDFKLIWKKYFNLLLSFRRPSSQGCILGNWNICSWWVRIGGVWKTVGTLEATPHTMSLVIVSRGTCCFRNCSSCQ